jgi:hypothetical protein
MKFNNLLVMEECGRDKNNGSILWKCQCDCGNYTILRTSILTGYKQKTCGNCKEIIKEDDYYRFVFLNNGKSFIFDFEDLELIKNYTWHLNKGYPQTCIKINDKTTTKRLHQFLINTKSGEVVDHINGDTLDNRRSNLRIANYQQNAANSRKQNKRIHSSNFKGVTFAKRDNKWLGRITFNGITKRKYFDTEIEAAKFYNKYALEYFGEFAKLNKIPQIENR